MNDTTTAAPVRDNAEAEIAAIRESTIGRIVGPTIMLGSGSYFDFADPEHSEITIEDVAYGLAFACRFAGQAVSRATGKRVFYSVAEHCVRMSYIVPQGFEFDALMHELGEPTCGDMTGPLKSLCPDYKAVEKRCEAAGLARFGVAMSDPLLIKRFDLIMLATEKRDLMPMSDGHRWEWVKGAEPLPDVIEPWDAYEAAERFLDRYNELRGLPRTGAAAAAPTSLSGALPGHWDSADGREMASKYLDKERSTLCKGAVSDMALANAVFLASRNDLDLMVWQTAAKERIRWLSAQLAAAGSCKRVDHD